MSLEDMGKQAYQKANWNDFKGAIEILNKAIKKFPKDARLYNNRSYCYCKLKEYNKSLEDANIMINLFPNYTKSYYRKGEALVGLNKLSEAENCFKKVLALDSSCDEARGQLLDVQLKLLCMDDRYSRREAEKALKLSDYNRKEAEHILSTSNSSFGYTEPDIYYSDEEIMEEACVVYNKLKGDIVGDPYRNPSNPFHCASIWVGNVTKCITEDVLKPIFSKYGKVKNIVVQHQHYCAFVNYFEPSMASKAMKLFPPEGKFVKDTNIVIRYPDSAIKNNLCLKKNGIKHT
ncbi:uncharacterized protein LOC142318298 isoform X2 [Lycorma delicatula]